MTVLSEDQRLNLATLGQGSQEWLNARSTLITASDFGSAAGLNRYKSIPNFLREKIGGSNFTGNHLTKWGNRFEDTACLKYQAYMRQVKKYTNFQVRHAGLIVLGQPRPFIGLSPDGLISYDDANGQTHHGLLEIKCPRFHRSTITPYYYAQIIGICGYMQLLDGKMRDRYPPPTFCDFVEWTLHDLWITRYYFDEEAKSYFRTMDEKIQNTYQLWQINKAMLEKGEIKLINGVLRGRLQTKL